MRTGDPSLLRFLTCGSVDDGKSTLIGRLLLEAGQIFDDQLAAVERDSRRHGTTGADTDLALLVDGLEAEREQGITIDVAYRYFATSRRSFIVADTPGHEQYTRNMATGASGSDLAILLVDARKGLLVQTCRHATICSLLGIRHYVLAVNKIDLVGFDEAVFRKIVGDFEGLSGRLGLGSVTAIPISARYGDNIAAPSASLPWYDGPPLLSYLESVSVTADPGERPFRFPVQWVNRPDANFRGYAGTVSSGRVGVGDAVISAISGVTTQVERILGPDADQDEASAGEAVTLVLSDEIDLSRGDVLATAANRPVVANQFTADLIWMSSEPLLPGRGYLMRIGPRWVPASVTLLKHKLNVDTQEELAATTLQLNEIGVANLSLASPAAFDPYADNRRGGAFILVDRFSNELVGAGMIRHPLRRALNIVPEHTLVEKQARAALKQQQPCCVWFTGLSGSGKSTLAKGLEKRLHELGRHTMLLDGDNLRLGLNGDLGFTSADRVENIRRAGEVAKLMTEAGLIVLCSFISPFQAERDMVRGLFKPEEFIEVFVDTPLEECRRRDVKGLYARALRGEIPNFTGVSSPYEAPQTPDARIDGSTPAGVTPADLERRLDAVLAPLVVRLGA
ncbi:sulfate adenylyltransferase subunit CysN [Bosea sp. (in: a-proteobacteria)]|uniref:sulfate adenylyltransferase subunit CysN n=1 Tax=Bosea sp. (in: a-proteobacteria) TaxID=1871050 RepID=UPI0026021F7C|nr:sulfate adenylyltransferase subunit CysN [Bosea sp. (in: a-proteobacteria)]MCO5090657.1 sulfate adenylyltransferase subunit CysN [Bosea sp. (in: a-proteobacteria)]